MVTDNRKWWDEAGLYTVTAIPYSARHGEGLPGLPSTVTFTISDIAIDQAPLSITAEDSL